MGKKKVFRGNIGEKQMAYLGKIGGPRISDILERIGYMKLFLNANEFEEDINSEEHGEYMGIFYPLLIDENGEPFCIFTGKRKTPIVYRFSKEEKELLGSDFKCMKSSLPEYYETFVG